MLRPLEEWDANYLDEINRLQEGNELERKCAAGLSPEEIAKQVCAFANAGGGFVVFGMIDPKHGGGFDEGVANMKGREPVKSWAENLIHKQHEPEVIGCQAIQILRSGQAPDKCVLVLHIPGSERRPHWLKSGKEESYLRVGEHSAEMRRQTFLDIANRRIVPVVEIESMNVVKVHRKEQHPKRTYAVNPIVRVVSGSICKDWLFECRIPAEIGRLEIGGGGGSLQDQGTTVVVSDHGPLFPGRATTVATQTFAVHIEDIERHKDKLIEVVLFSESARPVRRTFRVSELEK